MSAPRLGVGVIGAGRVGPVLAAAFAGAGHALTGITAGDDPERVSSVVGNIPVLAADEVVRRSELVVVAVPHNELEAVVAGLADLGAWQMGQLVLHTDARHGLDVLAPAAALGAIPLAVHPAVAFTGTSIDLRQLKGAYAGVTAPPAVLPIAQALAVELGCEPVVIGDAQRPAYGEAIETATHFSTSLAQQAAGLLAEAGVTEPGPFLSTLMHSALDRALLFVGDGSSAASEVEVPDAGDIEP